MKLSPDDIVFLDLGYVKINATIVFTWGVMLVLILLSWLATRKLTRTLQVSKWQNILEMIIVFIHEQIEEVIGSPAQESIRYQCDEVVDKSNHFLLQRPPWSHLAPISLQWDK